MKKLFLLIILFAACKHKDSSNKELGDILYKIASYDLKTHLKAPDSFRVKYAGVSEKFGDSTVLIDFIDSVKQVSDEQYLTLDTTYKSKSDRFAKKGLHTTGYLVSISYTAINSFNANLQSDAMYTFDSAMHIIRTDNIR